MEIDHEGTYFAILAGEPINTPNDDFPYITGYENVTRDQIREILQTYFEVDFGYDVNRWHKHIEDNGGWYFHYWENGGLFKMERQILRKYK